MKAGGQAGREGGQRVSQQETPQRQLALVSVIKGCGWLSGVSVNSFQSSGNMMWLHAKTNACLINVEWAVLELLSSGFNTLKVAYYAKFTSDLPNFLTF